MTHLDPDSWALRASFVLGLIVGLVALVAGMVVRWVQG